MAWAPAARGVRRPDAGALPRVRSPGAGQGGRGTPGGRQWCGSAATRCRPNRRRFVLWRSGACGARRPAQTAPNRGKAAAGPADTRGQSRGARAMAHTSIARPVPGRVRMPAGTRCLDGARAARHWRPGQRAAASWSAKWSEGMMLLDNPSPRIEVLRRKRRTFADAGGACRAVIGWVSAGGAGDCDRPRQDRPSGLRRGFWRCFHSSSARHVGP
jgi:hypothetical protein